MMRVWFPLQTVPFEGYIALPMSFQTLVRYILAMIRVTYAQAIGMREPFNIKLSWIIDPTVGPLAH